MLQRFVRVVVAPTLATLAAYQLRLSYKTKRIRGAFCDDALYKLTLTFTFTFLLVRHCNYSSILYHFSSYLTLNNIVTLKFGLEVTQVIEIGAIQKLGCGFLFAF